MPSIDDVRESNNKKKMHSKCNRNKMYQWQVCYIDDAERANWTNCGASQRNSLNVRVDISCFTYQKLVLQCINILESNFCVHLYSFLSFILLKYLRKIILGVLIESLMPNHPWLMTYIIIILLYPFFLLNVIYRSFSG